MKASTPARRTSRRWSPRSSRPAPTIVYWGGLHTEGGLIVRQMRDQGVKSVLISGDGITTDEFATIGGPGVEGTLMTFAPDPQKRPEAAEVVKKFEASNFKPEAYTLYSYAAVQIMADGAKRANSVDPKKIAEALQERPAAIKTVLGDLAFDKKGDITRIDYTLYTWKKQRGRQDHLCRELISTAEPPPERKTRPGAIRGGFSV